MRAGLRGGCFARQNFHMFDGFSFFFLWIFSENQQCSEGSHISQITVLKSVSCVGIRKNIFCRGDVRGPGAISGLGLVSEKELSQSHWETAGFDSTAPGALPILIAKPPGNFFWALPILIAKPLE